MNARKIFGMVLLAGLAIGPASAADLWLHLKVDGGRGDEQVEINVPLSMVESFAPLLQGKVRSDGDTRVRLRDRDYDVDELRRAWRQLEKGPDATYVTINEPDSKVRIAKRGAYVVMTALDRAQGENVEARIPITVMGALLSGSGDEIDVAAALRELVRFGEGELVTVTSEQETVRIWIDDDSR
ncbi:MAG TPA: hypothetical protein VHC97_11465 [Thermoanaerobaculia bacterium]|jgi:hypothetical protein|nr:hypothetical protein [Thermoanaerobaculia bacterium]